MQLVHLDSTLNELSVGTTLDNTGVVIKCQKQCDRVIGDCFATWIAICYLPNNPIHPYVVWSIVARPEGFVAQSGDYRKTLTEAVEAYEARGGHIG